MNLAPYWRLMWKEYRTVRGFWLALVALSIAGQALTMAVCRSEVTTTTLVFNLALGAPVFFAVGAAGMAFAIEKEEGTFAFLRAAPISARQIIVSKLAVAVGASLLMFLLLWPVAWGLLHQYPVGLADLRGMLGLWLAGAVEAIAWGTFFSLRSERPLVAICLAVAAASTSAHLLAWLPEWPKIQTQASDFSVYLAASPLRVGFALAILGSAIFRATRWLRDDGTGGKVDFAPAIGEDAFVGDVDPVRYKVWGEDRLVRRTWPRMIRYLLWQGWRQSAGTTVIIMGLIVALPYLADGGGFALLMPSWCRPWDLSRALQVAVFTTPVLAALLGSFVFMVDKERLRLRFLVGHNVPPRCVWLARQLHWVAALLIAVVVLFLVCGAGPLGEVRWLEQSASEMDGPWTLPPPADWHPGVLRPLAMLFLLLPAIPYTAGQWASMMVRSSVMAGVVGLVLAAVLCGWGALIGWLNFAWLWPVAVIPLVLLWATWLRAPDWIREETSWRARRRAAAAVLGPALALLIAVPLIRVYQIPWVDPGYDREKYPPPVSPEGQATADLYCHAMRIYVPLPNDKDRNSFYTLLRIVETNGRLSPVETKWLNDNSGALALALEGSKHAICDFGGSQVVDEHLHMWSDDLLTTLIIASARQLEGEGKLDESIERFFAALRVNAHFFDRAIGRSFARQPHQLFTLHQIVEWGARTGQSPERIEAAIARLQKLSPGVSRFEDELKRIDSGVNAYLMGDEPDVAPNFRWPNYHPTTLQFLYRTLLPWEKYRGRRMLNAITAAGLDRLREIHARLSAGIGAVELIPINDTAHGWEPEGYWNTPQDPPLNAAAFDGTEAAWNLVEFEAWRRASVLLLAIEAHKLRHGGKLPESLAELVGPELPGLPKDPYSGTDFRYFPNGLRQRVDFEAKMDVIDTHSHQTLWPWFAERPCIWCTGPELGPFERAKPAEATPSYSGESPPISFYDREKSKKLPLPESEVLGKGNWFAIPAPGK